MPEYSPSRIEEMLRDLPRREFRARLRSDLERRAASMTTVTDRVPATRQTATPQLRVRNAPAAIDFYKTAFGARELMRFEAGGRIAHAELEIGNSMILLGEEALDYGFPSPEALGGSPVAMRLYVDDVDGFVEQAVRAGARLVMPVSDQFYGDRTGRVIDPFGHSWAISTRKEEMSVEEMHRRMAAMEAAQRATRTAETFIPKGFHTVTPYVVVHDAPGLIAFTTSVFGAQELRRSVGSGGGIHAEVRIDDSILMIGGGAPPDRAWSGQQWTTALHIYVRDTDATFARALDAGAVSIGEPRDQEYGERSAGVRDATGNTWYIATAKGERHIPDVVGLQTINVYLHPLRAEPVLAFMTRAFGAVDVAKYASPDGVVHHATARIGDSVIEMGEANGPYQPMPTRFYLYVPSVDATYQRALTAGATSVSEPADQPYGDRLAGVKDAFGNEWFIATQLRETR
jgi:PhnB protein